MLVGSQRPSPLTTSAGVAVLPLIGVTMSWVAGTAARPPRAQVNDAYLRAIEAAGGLPMPIGPGMVPAALDELLARVDGLVLTGGGDVAPALYEQEPHPKTDGVAEVRDGTEQALILAALAQQTPLLAICRGMQILNVVLGGSLHQHVPDAFGDAILHAQAEGGAGRKEATHPIRIEAGTTLAALSGGTKLQVNSLHHQSVDRLGRDARAIAWAEDGVIEAMELPGARLVAVQWHPEELASQDPAAAALFRWVVDEARGLGPC